MFRDCSTNKCMYYYKFKMKICKLYMDGLLFMYKYLTTFKPEYFALFLCLCKSAVKTRYSKLERCFSMFLLIAPQFINLKFISTSASHMMLQNSGMICHWKFELLLHFHVSKGDLKPICLRILSLPSFSTYQTPMVSLGMTCLCFMIY